MATRYTYSSITEALSLLSEISSALGDQFRADAYNFARAFPERAGDHITQKIREFHRTGRIRELDNALAKPQISAALALSRVFGFGPATVRDAISRGILSIDDLRARAGEMRLTRAQRLGIQYYDDLRKKIPRMHVRRMAQIIFTAIFTVWRRDYSGADPRVDIAGSFRRGFAESSDIDILMSAECNSRKFIGEVNTELSGRSEYVAMISMGSQKLTILMRGPFVMHVDLMFVEPESYAAALLYFTGSQLFNIRMREYCKERGFMLNQTALKRNGHIIPTRTEEDIFAACGMPYTPPNLRV